LGLREQPEYNLAKSQGNVNSALAVIEGVVREKTLEYVYDMSFCSGGQFTPTIVAPAAQPGMSGNALAISYAQWLGNELGWPVERNIFQEKLVSRDRHNAWFRLGHRPAFYGAVQAGGHYIIADDVFTLGGTMAELRGFIMSGGGLVVGMTALAHSSGENAQIALAKTTLDRLLYQYQGVIDEFCRQEIGYGTACLTEPEAGVLLGLSSLDCVRKAINGSRNIGAAPSRRPRPNGTGQAFSKRGQKARGRR
jgi:hypothetical protein